MPSALETLVKILKLEREQGCTNRAVVGGMAAYSVTWKQQALTQARRAEHRILAEELGDLLQGYELEANKLERMKQIDYMLDRIIGRIPAPPEYHSDEPPPAKVKHHENRSIAHEEEDRSNADFEDNDDLRPVEQGTLDLPPMPTLARPPRKHREKLSLEEEKKRLAELDEPITAVKGIGKSKFDQFDTLGIRTVEDMLYYFPRRYDDYTRLRYISRIEPNEIVTIIGTVVSTEVRLGKNNRKDFLIVVEDGSGSLNVTFFGQHFLSRTIYRGHQVVLSGKTSIWRDRLQMANPEWERLDSENLHTIGIVPVYPLTEGLTARSFRRLVKKSVDQYVNRIPDHIPEATLERTELADLGWTLKNLHFPDGWDHLHHARRRFIFDQLLTLQLSILGNRREWQSVEGQPLQVDDDWLDSFAEAVFPYELTGAQIRAVQAIRTDMEKSLPMNRLLQGDVGAGKTAVALMAIGIALGNRKQAALMAPTSILAEQHYRGMSAALENFPGEFRPVIALLTGSLTTSERESVYRGIADGSIDLVIGTHALIQEGLEFHDLALAIVDEQHRFGVEQRSQLRGKGTNPHLMVMTATPIPRTLALTMYADLDLSVIDEKPPGRQPVETRLLLPIERERAFSFVESHLREGRQAFLIHPLVEASDKIEARAATQAYEELQQIFYKYRVCLLHGRMSPAEKDEIMTAFAGHEYDVMVTTSVAEVGVDVPNASVILIEGANRFGLAQLHQFRGRVGRGMHKSFCLLIPDNLTEEAEQRLRALEKTDDGFQLAEMDWKMRGAGDLLGTRQSGGHILEMAEEITPDLVELAQREAKTIYEEDPDLRQSQHALLAEKISHSLSRSGGDVS